MSLKAELAVVASVLCCAAPAWAQEPPAWTDPYAPTRESAPTVPDLTPPGVPPALSAEPAPEEKGEEGATEDKKEDEKQVAGTESSAPRGPEPELDLPIRYFVYSAILSGLGYATGLLSAGPERDLRDPSKHDSRFASDLLYIRAYYGGLVSRGFYALSGTMAAYGGFKLQGAIREYLTAQAKYHMQAHAPGPDEAGSTETLADLPPPPPIRAGVVLLPGGAGAGLSFDF